jgi:hypothetical protein
MSKSIGGLIFLLSSTIYVSYAQVGAASGGRLTRVLRLGFDPEAQWRPSALQREDRQMIPLDPSSDRLSVSTAGRSVAAPADALPTREPRSAGDLMRGDGVADGASHMAHDVFGSAVATAAFQGASGSLVIESVVEFRPEATAWPIFNIPASAILYPFRHSSGQSCVRRGAWPSGLLLVLSECGAGAREIWLTT